MKKVIFTLGTFLLISSFSSVIAMSVNSSNLQNNCYEFKTSTLNSERNNSAESPKFKFAPVDDQTILNPEEALNLKYRGDIKELIIEDNKIIDSTSQNLTFYTIAEKSIEESIKENLQIIDGGANLEFQPLFIDRTIEDIIDEDNKIIESEL